MTIVAVVGDATTTTAVALSVGWSGGEAVVVEADRGGGSLAAWLDTPAHPTLATIVATAASAGERRDVMAIVDSMTHHSSAGVRFVSNAARARAASLAVEEAAFSVLPAMSASERTLIADTGRHRGGDHLSPAVRSGDVVVVVHRQAAASAAAASVRVERLIETFEDIAHADAPVVLAVIGTAPFDVDELSDFVDAAVPDTIASTVALADDPLAAFTIAGRTGVSARRLRRLPFMRDAARAADVLGGLTANVRPRTPG
jgi:MinD-like ATPase involved in chromosome partitioning or flagellar assembly